MRSLLIAAVAGLLFGLGLTVSAMIDPGKVLGFLDIAGDWDPSLIFVMAGGIPVAALGYVFGRRDKPAIPTAIDRRLLLGAALFGVGWGLVGYCPGPALASLGFGNPSTVLFVAAMLTGMAAFEVWNRRA
jgi:uncharacterized membrane protein YedE/YeeE